MCPVNRVMNNQPNRGRTLRKVSTSRPSSRSASPIYATLNRQNAFTGIAETAEALNAPAKVAHIQENMRLNRPQSASYTPISRPQSASSNTRPKSASLVPIQPMQAVTPLHAQLKTFHIPLQHHQGSRSLIRTRRRKNRKARKSRRN